MKVFVERNICENHGQCALAADQVFRMNAQGTLEYEPSPDDALRPEVEEAADLCPVQAIFLDRE